MRTFLLRFGCAACVGFIMFSAGCTSRATQPADSRRPPATVVIAEASRRDIPLEIDAIGYGEPYLTVAVRARVTGQLVKVGFQQGEDVKEGDLLFAIDPRPYQDMVDQAEATLAKDRAALRQAEAAAARDRATEVNAKAQGTRYADLFHQGIVSKEQNDQFQSTAESTAAAVRADEANIAVARESIRLDQAKLADARLQLSYTEIRAPISGRTGNLNVQIGNMVKDSDSTPLVVINKISPIYVTFSIPESGLADVRRYSRAGGLKVTAAPPQAGGQPEAGVLDFIDNTVDTATGTIRLKGLFQNTGRRLWPGQFLNVVLNLATNRGAVVVPSAAVQTGQNGKYVFVVDSNMVAHQRDVEVGPTSGEETVIRSGLAPAERVVEDGQLGVVSGGRVQPASQSGAGPRALAP